MNKLQEYIQAETERRLIANEMEPLQARMNIVSAKINSKLRIFSKIAFGNFSGLPYQVTVIFFKLFVFSGVIANHYEFDFILRSNFVQIGIVNNDTETDRWTIFRNFTLKYFGSQIDLSSYEELLAAAVAAAAVSMPSNVS